MALAYSRWSTAHAQRDGEFTERQRDETPLTLARAEKQVAARVRTTQTTHQPQARRAPAHGATVATATPPRSAPVPATAMPTALRHTGKGGKEGAGAVLARPGIPDREPITAGSQPTALARALVVGLRREPARDVQP